MTHLISSSFFTLSLGLSVINSSSLEQLDQAHLRHKKYSILKYECKKQITKNKIPSSCFKIAYMKNPPNNNFIKFLNEKCDELSFDPSNLISLSHTLKNLQLSPECFSILAEKERILKIQLADEPIKRVLNTYMKK